MSPLVSRISSSNRIPWGELGTIDVVALWEVFRIISTRCLFLAKNWQGSRVAQHLPDGETTAKKKGQTKDQKCEKLSFFA